MKNLIVAALMIFTIASYAQEARPSIQKPQAERLTLEQRNQLHLKKMTLELDLNSSQQKEMSKIIAEQSSKRDAAMAERKANKEQMQKMTADERYKKKNEMLDEQMVMKARVKKILSAEQFAKWETMKDRKQHKMKKHMGERHGKAVKKEDK